MNTIRKGWDFTMKIMGQISLAFVIRLMTDIIFLLNIATLLFLPFGLLSHVYNLFNATYLVGESYNFLLLFLYVCGFLTLGILALGHMFLRSLEKNPLWFRLLFVDLLLLTLSFLAKLLFYPTLLTMLGAYLLLLLALLALILSEIFRQACKIWEENELTV